MIQQTPLLYSDTPYYMMKPLIIHQHLLLYSKTLSNNRNSPARTDSHIEQHSKLCKTTMAILQKDWECDYTKVIMCIICVFN